MSARVALALALAGLSCGPATPSAPQVAPVVADAGPRTITLSTEGVANAEVRSVHLAPGSFSPRLVVNATIVADPQRVARVGARVPGRVAALRVAVGDAVVVGQPLVDVDAVELHQVSMEYLTAIARAREANDARARQRRLVAERVGAVQDLRRAEADAEVAAAALHEADEHLHFLGLSDRDIRGLRAPSTHGEARTIVRAPIAGRVAAVGVALGQVLVGTEDVATIADLTTVQVTLRLYERDLPRVALGTPVDVRLPGVPDRVFAGALSFVSELADPVSHTIEARAALANPDGALRPGMSAVASLALRPTDAAALWLPVEAVQPDAGERVVFVRLDARRFEARRVAVGAEQGGYVPVLAGVTVADDVVVHGAFALRGELERAELEE